MTYFETRYQRSFCAISNGGILREKLRPRVFFYCLCQFCGYLQRLKFNQLTEKKPLDLSICQCNGNGLLNEMAIWTNKNNSVRNAQRKIKPNAQTKETAFNNFNLYYMYEQRIFQWRKFMVVGEIKSCLGIVLWNAHLFSVIQLPG